MFITTINFNTDTDNKKEIFLTKFKTIIMGSYVAMPEIFYGY